MRWKGAVQPVQAVFDTLLSWAFLLRFILFYVFAVGLSWLVSLFVFRALWAGEGERISFPQTVTKLLLLQTEYFSWPTEMFLI